MGDGTGWLGPGAGNGEKKFNYNFFKNKSVPRRFYHEETGK